MSHCGRKPAEASMERNLPTLMKEVGLGSSPLVSRMLGLTVDLEEGTSRKGEAENGNSKESSASDSLAAGANKEPNGVRPQRQCNVCHKLFRTQKDLLQHLRNNRLSHPHVCFTCCKSFFTSEELVQHRRNHQRPHMCSICEKSFTRSTHLKDHIKMHSENKALKCNVCFRRYTNSRNFQAHMDKHQKKDVQEALHNGASSPPPASRSNLLPWADLLGLPSPVNLSQDSSDDGPLDLSKTSSVPSRPAKSSSEAVLSSCGEPLSKEAPRKLFLFSDFSPTKSLQMNGWGFSMSSNRRSWMRKDGSSRALHKCSVCHLIFSHGGELLAHGEKAHPPSKPYCCCACDISFAEVEDLEAHARAEHGETGASV